jgi:hypothetical protein
MYQHSSPLGTVGSFILGGNHQFTFWLEMGQRVSAALATTPSNLSIPSADVTGTRYYTVGVDIFSVELVPEYTYVLRNGTGVTLRCPVTLINLGITASILGKTNFNQTGMASANIIPLAFCPAILFDFGRSGLGLGVYMNTWNFITYRYFAPPLARDNDNGLQNFDPTFKQVAVRLLFTY